MARLFPPERVFLSAQWKLLKPEPAYYQEALRHFGLRAEECLFIDDTPTNVEAAVRAGIGGVVFHADAVLLRAELRARGVRAV